jgi:hypothetical protein
MNGVGNLHYGMSSFDGSYITYNGNKKIYLKKLPISDDGIIDCWEFAYTFNYLWEQLYTTLNKTYKVGMIHAGSWENGHFWNAIYWTERDVEYFVPFEVMKKEGWGGHFKQGNIWQTKKWVDGDLLQNRKYKYRTY